MIGDDIVITIVDVRGDKVRLGINAPNTIPVHRMEVWEAIQRELKNAEAQINAENEGASKETPSTTDKLGSGIEPNIAPQQLTPENEAN